MENPPYKINSKILSLISDIQYLLGESKGLAVKKPSVKLRKENKIKTIHHSLALEGNSLSPEQISTLLEGRKVIGPKSQILEVKNAIKLYDQIDTLNPFKEADLLKAHKVLMYGLLPDSGNYRRGAVGIFKAGQVSRMAPPPQQVSKLMRNLFSFVRLNKDTLTIVKACIFHYEFEFIHPFADGNGRMGRLWQQLILMRASPIFEYVPIETLIHQNQKKYYEALEKSDVMGESTVFIEFSLDMILKALKEFSNEYMSLKLSGLDRIDSAIVFFKGKEFSRKDYMIFHKDISTATASRDLAKAVNDGKLKISGMKALAKYKV